MLRFFRQIRQRLLTENRFSKYLLYAIGEIMLVVIGILIALQVDSWNDAREEKRVEGDLLLGLQNNLRLNINQLEDLIETNFYGNNRIQRISAILEDESEPIDTICNLYHLAFLHQVIDLPLHGYKALENRGYETIRNKPLRDSIIQYFENEYSIMQRAQEYMEDTKKLHEEFSKENLMQVWGKKDENGISRLIFEPMHSNKVWKSKEFYALLNAKHFQRNWTINQLQLFLEKTIQLDNQINKELKSR